MLLPICFPNVDDPWMFTEYVFKGKEIGEIVVEPPLYDEKTLTINNADISFEEEEFVEDNLLDKYDKNHYVTEIVREETEPGEEIEEKIIL